MLKSKKLVVVKKEVSYAFASTSFTFMGSEPVDPHRRTRLDGVTRYCNNDMLLQQEYGWPDEEE